MNYSLAIFDLDGTLVDSLQDLAESANQAASSCGYPTRSIDEVRFFVGDGVRKLIERTLPAGTPEEDVDKSLALFHDVYDVNKLKHTYSFDGVAPFLHFLHTNGVKVAVLSNKYDSAVKTIAAQLFGYDVDLAIGESSETPRKPNPQGLLSIMSHFNCKASDVLYVGDSDVDMLTGRNAGVDTAGVLWGFRNKSVLLNAGAKYICSDVSQLQSLF